MLRDQMKAIEVDLKRKMVLISGPRQVGKSWLAAQISKRYPRSRYLNWDNSLDREVILNQGWSRNTDLLVLDEIHKMDHWKSHLKGIWDSRPEGMSILVTGSARLEVFRQSGDSLAGRYFLHRLFPITPSEAARAGELRSLEHHVRRGGFPEPWLALSEDDAGRWRRQYLDGLIREDILTFENITRLRAMNLLVEMLRDRVASPLSYQALGEDLGVSPNTVKHYVEILEALYVVFRVYPHHRSIARSLLQQPKLYFFDTGLVRGDAGRALENMVAVSLHREFCLREDRDGKVRRLCYLRTKEGREVDFVLTQEDKPLLMVEAKSEERRLTDGLRHFNGRYGIAGVQLVADLHQEMASGPLQVRRALDWLSMPEQWIEPAGPAKADT